MMHNADMIPLFQRWLGNPVLDPRPGDWEGLQVRNPAVWREDGLVYMVYTARNIMNTIHLGLATSGDGLHFIRASDRPFLSPVPGEFDGGTVEDARIVRIDGEYLITYSARAVGKQDFLDGTRSPAAHGDGIAWTQNARRGGLLRTRDFRTIERLGPITSDNLYDCNIILFPERIKGRYVMLHRPSAYNEEVENLDKQDWSHLSGTRPGIHISYSDDLRNWYGDQVLAVPEQPWEAIKIGGSTPPLRTEAGWLLLYHGVSDTVSGGRFYRVGLMLLDLEDPYRVIARSPYPVMEPETAYELTGTVPGVVFPTGIFVVDGLVHVYYGAADTVCCLATARLDRLLAYLKGFT